MALNKVEICGVNTSKLPSLTEAEKTELFRRIKNGDREARGICERKLKTRAQCDQAVCGQ